jgi:hypothetical protein
LSSDHISSSREIVKTFERVIASNWLLFQAVEIGCQQVKLTWSSQDSVDYRLICKLIGIYKKMPLKPKLTGTLLNLMDIASNLKKEDSFVH